MESIKDIITLPWLIGHHTTDKDGRITYQDGYISGIMLFVILMTLGICLGIGQYITTEQTRPIETYVVEGTITVYMAICIAFIIVVTCTRVRDHVIIAQKTGKKGETEKRDATESSRLLESLEGGTDNNQRDRLFERLKKILPLIGIMFFLLGVILLDFFRLIAYGTCLSEYDDVNLVRLKKEAITAIIYHVVRTFFALLITYFCCTFLYKEMIFRNVWQMRYGLMMLLATLLCIWSESQLYESQGIFESYTKEEELYNCTIQRNISFAEKCHHQVSYGFCLSEEIGVYLFPLNVEFALLVSECLLHLFFSMGKEETKKEKAKASEVKADINVPSTSGDMHIVQAEMHSDPISKPDTKTNDSGASTSSDNTPEVEIRPSTSPKTGMVCRNKKTGQNHSKTKELQITTYGSVNQGQVGISSSGETDNTDKGLLIDDQDGASTQNSDQQSTFHRLPLLFLSIVLGLLYIVLSVCNITFPKDEEGKALTEVYFIFKMIYWLITIGITFVGFSSSRYFKSKQEAFTGFQILIMLSSFGYYVYYFFSIPAAIAILKGSHANDTNEDISCQEDAILVIFDTTLNAIQVYYQVVFMFHAISIDPKSVKETRPINYRVFKQILLYLGTANLFIWCVDSFFEVNNFQQMGPVQVSYYSKQRWEVITHMSYPLTLFFRFNSCINILLTYLTI